MRRDEAAERIIELEARVAQPEQLFARVTARPSVAPPIKPKHEQQGSR